MKPKQRDKRAMKMCSGQEATAVRFSLGGDYGLDVFAADSPWSGKIPTNPGAPLDSIEETVSAGSSGLSYAGGTDQYTYVWKTSKSWAGTSRF